MLESDAYKVEVEIDKEDAKLNRVYAVPCYFIENGDEILAIPEHLHAKNSKMHSKI